MQCILTVLRIFGHMTKREVSLIAITVALFILGVICSFAFEDTHYIQRFGALISGFSALYILIQVRAEIRMEKKHLEYEKYMKSGKTGTLYGPKADAVERIIRSSVEDNKTENDKKRLRFVGVVACCALFGEIVHGFGDLLFFNHVISKTSSNQEELMEKPNLVPILGSQSPIEKLVAPK